MTRPSNSKRYPAASEFTKDKPIAVFGVSSANVFGNAVVKELRSRGYKVYVVHPAMTEFEGERCYSSLQDLPEPVENIFICVKPEHAGEIVDQATNAGVKRIWFQQGADFSELATRAREAGLETVSGRCILMYTEPVGGIHGVHRWLSRLFSKY
jgi:hypothetical protein